MRKRPEPDRSAAKRSFTEERHEPSDQHHQAGEEQQLAEAIDQRRIIGIAAAVIRHRLELQVQRGERKRHASEQQGQAGQESAGGDEQVAREQYQADRQSGGQQPRRPSLTGLA